MKYSRLALHQDSGEGIGAQHFRDQVLAVDHGPAKTLPRPADYLAAGGFLAGLLAILALCVWLAVRGEVSW